MKKYLVDIYLAYNLGDDMFLDHLAASFPNHQFVPFYPGNGYNNFFDQYPNITKFPYSFLDKILSKIAVKNKLSDFDSMADEYDGLIFLGGGIFREESYWKSVFEYRNTITDAFLAKSKEVCFIGCNFGPYQSKEFESAYRALFKKCSSVCFRDQKSYHLFNELDNVSYAPDVLWDYKLPNVNQSAKTIGISIVNPKHKFGLEKYYDDYVLCHQKLIQQYVQKGFNVKLFSFCEAEGDLEVCNEIAKVAPDKIEVFNYNGNINSYLVEFGKCSEIIAARFHAVIIAMKFQIPVLPVIYGDKTRNLLEDLSFENRSIEFDALNILEKGFQNVYVEPKIDKFIRSAHQHFVNIYW